MNAKKLFELLTSMRASIVLLITLGIIASFGTIIPQGYSNDVILEQYGSYLGQLILVLGLDDLYHAWWFIALGMLLFAQVLICTFRRMKKVRSVRQLGSIVIHLSFMIVLCGAFASFLTGTHEVINASIGETVNLSEKDLASTSVTVNDFSIDYYDQGIASQYYCDLTYKDKNGNTTNKDISVNHPFSKGGIKIYQQSFGWESEVTLSLDGKNDKQVIRDGDSIDLGDGKTLQVFFLPDYDEQSQTLESKSNKPNNPVLVAGILSSDGSVSDMVLLHPNETQAMLNGTITFDRYALYTVLNVKHDRSVGIIFTGFIVATLGLILRYLPFGKRKKEEENGVR